ncbi:MAG: LytTR family transcriptional regulator [Bacteroidales bacterium]|nr:LytTR family transcriptional regulator [Bacteroidales bacterium]
MQTQNTNNKFWSYENNIFLVPVIFGIFIFLFLFTLQPLGISEIEQNKLIFSLSFGVITFVILLINDAIRKFVMKKKFSFVSSIFDKIKGFMIAIPIAIFNWIALYFWRVDHDFNFWIMLFTTFILGGIPYFYISLFVERKYYMENFYKLNSVLEKKEDFHGNNNQQIRIVTENINEKLNFKPQNLLFIKAEGNYALFNFILNNKIEKKLVRISLSKIIEQLAFQNVNDIVRNHKSFIVNLQNVDKVTGNSRSYSFHLKNTDITIPVSRSFSQEIIKQLQSHHNFHAIKTYFFYICLLFICIISFFKIL